MLVHSISKWARAQPSKIALVHDGNATTFASFANAIGTTRAWLARRPHPDGRLAIVSIRNLRYAWTATLALRALGWSTTSVPSLAHAKELNLRGKLWVVGADEDSGTRQLTGDDVNGLAIDIIPRAVLEGADGPGPGSIPIAADPSGGHILHTSGSTGVRKKVLLDAAIEDAANAHRAAAFGFDAATVHHALDFALWTGGGYKRPAAVWHVGGCVVADQRPDNFKNFLTHGVNRSVLLVPMLREIVEHLDTAHQPSGDLRVGTGGMIVPRELAEATVARLTRNLEIIYSATELSTSGLMSIFRTADDLHWLSPVGDRVAQVVDADGADCPPDLEGALRFGISGLDCSGYLDDAAASAMAFRDGYFYPGDRAVKRADGRIRILGRQDDVINIDGQKFAAVTLEQSLQRDLRVKEVCLFTGPLRDARQELVIAIETDRDLPSYELEAAKRQFHSFDVRAVVLRAFPRSASPTGKVRREELKKRLFAPDQGAQIIEN